MGPIRIGLVIVAVAGALGAAWYFWPGKTPEPPPTPAAPAMPAPAPELPPPPPKPEHYPVPEPAEPKEAAKTPLALNDSDKPVQEAIAGLVGRNELRRHFYLENLVRHIVVTVDNLPRKNLAMRLSPVSPVGGLLVTKGKDASLALAPENAARYATHVKLVEKLDAKKLVAVYVRFYALFQQAYVELGYPDGHFNTRLVQVIDHLLAAPEPAEPVRLTVPHVLHEYADPALEGESAGRKVLFRMGNANAARVKAKLREIRGELVKAP